MVRAPCCDKNGLKRGPWAPEEDQKLVDYIQKNGCGNWRTLPKNAGLQRCGKSCRLRWTNYLRPDIKRGRFSFEEEETIIQLHGMMGNKWSAIAARLPGRTDNEIKNFWNTHIRKRLLRMGIDPVTHSPRLDLLDMPSILSSQMSLSSWLGVQPLVNPELLKIATSLLSSQNVQNSQTCTRQLENQMFQQDPVHEIPVCTTLTTPCGNVPYPSEAQVMISNGEQFSCNNLCQLNEWDSNNLPSNLTGDIYVSDLQNYGLYGSEQSILTEPLPSETSNSAFQSHGGNTFGFLSVLSTPQSSPTPLNSSSTNLNGSTEDERESYCSNNNMLNVENFGLPQMINVGEFM
ncbi:hypothetical protein NMG60_11012596 [Bertholletia excelsa]